MIQPLALDDLSYDDLVAQARALIPTLCPEWTDHNPSDPGIALIELFAWLSEMVIYRINRVPEESYRAFLDLLSPPADGAAPQATLPPLEDAVRATVASLRTIDRAVTLDDFARLTLGYESPTRSENIERVRCVPDVDLVPRYTGFFIGRTSVVGRVVGQPAPAPGDVSVVVLTDAPTHQPSPELLAELTAHLAPRCLITTRPHVVGPRIVHVTLAAVLYLTADGTKTGVDKAVRGALAGWFDPLTGGPDGTGWPFGRRLHPSEIYRLLDSIPGLDFIEDAEIRRSGVAVPDGIDMSNYEIAIIDDFELRYMQPVGGGWNQV